MPGGQHRLLFLRSQPRDDNIISKGSLGVGGGDGPFYFTVEETKCLHVSRLPRYPDINGFLMLNFDGLGEANK